MSYPINYPTPQGANVQIFQGGDPQAAGRAFEKTWVKPQGASFVWFTLIGSGGGNDSGGTFLVGGGSGAVTNCMVPAFLIPDSLAVVVGKGGSGGASGADTYVYYQQKNVGYVLLSANAGRSGGTDGGGGVPMTANYFTAMGFFQSIAGQPGAGTVTPSATTFLSGGNYTGSTLTANYGYSTSTSGFFQMQPIIVGLGASSSTPGKAGIGCGAYGGTALGEGGDGLVVIVTW